MAKAKRTGVDPHPHWKESTLTVKNAGKTVMNSVKLCQLAESLGSVDTMITHPATMTHAEVPRADREQRGLTDGLVRISVGIEHIDDIIADLEQALEKV
jgi:cystathionine beta-lyase/cystathionine gamma-synthase